MNAKMKKYNINICNLFNFTFFLLTKFTLTSPFNKNCTLDLCYQKNKIL